MIQPNSEYPGHRIDEPATPQPPVIHCPLFDLGQCVITRGALDAMREQRIEPSTVLQRHAHGDFGQLSREDLTANIVALADGERILSVYEEKTLRFYVLTEADRSLTTILLPEEY